MTSSSHWGPTDALLHGGFSQPNVQTLEVRFDASSLKQSVADELANIDTVRSTYKELTGEQTFQIASVKEIGQELIDLLNTVPMSREIALALTKVEESVMWAVKGLSK
jgi:hypothetical protein